MPLASLLQGVQRGGGGGAVPRGALRADAWDDNLTSLVDDPAMRSLIILVVVLGGVVIVLFLFAAAIRCCAPPGAEAAARGAATGSEAARALMSDYEGRDEAGEARRRGARALE